MGLELQAPGHASFHSGGLSPKDDEDPIAKNKSLDTFWWPATWGSESISKAGVHMGDTRVAQGGSLWPPAAQDFSAR